jgi:hypothetical protein
MKEVGHVPTTSNKLPSLLPQLHYTANVQRGNLNRPAAVVVVLVLTSAEVTGSDHSLASAIVNSPILGRSQRRLRIGKSS